MMYRDILRPCLQPSSPPSRALPSKRFSNLKIRGYKTTYFYFRKYAFRKLNFHLQRQPSTKSTLLTLSQLTKTQFLNYVFAKTKVNRLIYLDFSFHRGISVGTLRQLLKLDFYTALLHSSKGRHLTKSYFHESTLREKFLLDEPYSFVEEAAQRMILLLNDKNFSGIISLCLNFFLICKIDFFNL